MSSIRKSILGIGSLLLLAGTFAAGYWYSQRAISRRVSSTATKILYYVDPMHPAYKSEKPGVAPDCGMQLEPVYADGKAPASNEDTGFPAPPGMLNISADKQQRIGVRVSTAEKSAGCYVLRLFGRAAPDETRVYKLTAGIDGFIRTISPVTTGSYVERDQWLATFASPDTRAPIQGFLVTLSAMDQQRAAGPESSNQAKQADQSLRVATDRLQNMGMSTVQIEEVRRTRDVPTDIRILAPAAGFVLARNASVGQRFEKGAEWYRIADLSRVWILADVFEKDAHYLRPGMRARVSLPDQKALPAVVSEVLPQFDAASRTLKVRLEMDNPEYTIRPDMFVDVEVPVGFPPTLLVPREAVMNTGLKKTVFLDRGEGNFEPREVETGAGFKDRIEIVKGLAPGDRVVTSGNFLVDSESRMQAAAAAMEKAVKDPVCGRDMSVATAKFQDSRNGENFVFCSARCKEKFNQAPERYTHTLASRELNSARAPRQ
jgi:RND family efflux transporter MFP subunit